MPSIRSKVILRLRNFGAGSVVTPADFLDLGSREAIDVVLHRLLQQGKLRRLARGLYEVPRADAELGALAPSVQTVVEALQKRDQIKLQASGAYAANQLGLSEQLPLRIVFYTDGPERRITLGKQVIFLKHTTPRNMATAGRISGQVIQALRYIGKAHVDDTVVAKLRRQLTPAEKKQLVKDIRYAPVWVGAIMRRIMAEPEE